MAGSRREGLGRLAPAVVGLEGPKAVLASLRIRSSFACSSFLSSSYAKAQEKC